jgi:hypothetical protein
MRRVRWLRWRLVRLLALVLLSIWFGTSTLADHSKWLRYRHVYSRGVTTTASVLSYKYDPDGGDPGGWTTDRVAFTSNDGESVTAIIGHYNPGPEKLTGRMHVTYDPVHPAVVIAADADVSPTDGSELWGGLLIAIPTALGAIALAVWSFAGLRRTPEGASDLPS